jgi:hypothetical protein
MNRAEIQAALHRYIHRTDAGTIDNELTALELARVAVARDFFPREASVLVELPVADGKAALPPDFGRPETVAVRGVGSLDYLTPRDYANRITEGTTAGVYTTGGLELRVDPGVSEVVVVYYATPGELVDDGSSSWLSVAYPDILLYRAIAEQQRFLQDWEQAITAENYAVQLIALAQQANKASETAGGGLKVKGR